MHSKEDRSRQFLNKFVEEILLTLWQIEFQKTQEITFKAEIEQKVAAEKLRRKILEAQRIAKEEKLAELRKQEMSLKPFSPVMKPVNKEPMQPSMEVKEKPVQENKVPEKLLNTPKNQQPPLIKIAIPKQKIPLAQPGEINFGVLILLIRDPSISYIECTGEEKNVIIRKGNSIFSTDIKLTKLEINDFVNSFSEKTRIPIVSGLLDARLGNLELSASLSEINSSTFILRKTNIPANFQVSPPGNPVQFKPQFMQLRPNNMAAMPSNNQEQFQKSIIHN